jgi:hypothetical protein
MPTPLSNTGKLLTWLGARDMPVMALAEVAKLNGIRFASTTKLNEAFRDVAPLNADTSEKLLALVEEIETLCQRAQPLRLDLSDGAAVYSWLTQFRQERMFVMVLCDLLAGEDGEHNQYPRRISLPVGTNSKQGESMSGGSRMDGLWKRLRV